MPGIFYVSYIAMWLLLTVQGILLLLVYRHFGLVAMGSVEGIQRDGIKIGEVAPVVTGVTLRGDIVEWNPVNGHRHLLMFVSPDCEPCARILPYIKRLEGAASDLSIALVVHGSSDSVGHLVSKFALPKAFICLGDSESGVRERYRVRVTPFAFVIGEDGRIQAKGLCSDPGRLADILTVGGTQIPTTLLETASIIVKAGH